MREVQTMVCKVDDASMRPPFWAVQKTKPRSDFCQRGPRKQKSRDERGFDVNLRRAAERRQGKRPFVSRGPSRRWIRQAGAHGFAPTGGSRLERSVVFLSHPLKAHDLG